jgi:DNA invertase Pin-like site-specific DNA recombinase
VVDDIDRIGREALETLNYIYMLREYGVTITTPQNGEVDVWQTSGRTIACMKTLFADVENSARVRRMKQGLNESFVNGNWWARFKKVPFGYKEDGGSWIEIDEEQAGIYQRAVDSFLNVSLNRPYSRTVEIANLEKRGISERQLSVLLRRPVYKGKPTINKTADEVVHGDKEPTVVVDPDLTIVDEETFEKVQKKVDKIHDRYSTDESATNDVGDFIDRFGIDSVTKASDHVELRCAEDGCNGKLIKYGRRETDGIGTHNYRCQNECCGKQRKWPNLKEISEMRKHSSDG